MQSAHSTKPPQRREILRVIFHKLLENDTLHLKASVSSIPFFESLLALMLTAFTPVAGNQHIQTTLGAKGYYRLCKVLLVHLVKLARGDFSITRFTFLNGNSNVPD